MKALVLRGPNQAALEDVPKPVPGDSDLLVRTMAGTICTSDLNDMATNPFHIPLPVIMGHEGAGIVEAVGRNVTGFKPGDEVTAHPVMPCGSCSSCRRGLAHLCDNMEHLALTRGGVFAEFFTIRADRVRMKPASLSFAEATLMEPICVCLEAIERANVKPGDNVLVTGDGPFGVMTAKLCQAYRPAKVILSGRHPFRLSMAEGAVRIHERGDGKNLDDIMDATNGEGIDAAILCVGTAQAVETCIAALRSRGTLSVFSGIEKPVPVDLFKVHVKELNICGSCNDMELLDKALELLQDKSLNLGKVITDQMPLDKWEEAFDLARRGKDRALKVTFVPGEGGSL